MAGLSKENPFKNVFNQRVIESLADRIKANYSAFEQEHFIEEACAPLEDLGFLERSHHIRDMLYKYLPSDYSEAIHILIKSLGPDLENAGETDWDSFIVMPQCAYVTKYGTQHYDLSMNALYEMTKRFTAEGDLRTFLEIDYDKTMTILKKWCSDESVHVRRLVSEGTRPRLPLSGRIKRFQDNPEPVIELLDLLKDDPDLYVRRSVANNINDIAKDNPDIAIATLKRWNDTSDKNVKWVVKHASRTLVKQGHPKMLEVLGYHSEPKIQINAFSIDHGEYKLNDNLMMTLELECLSDSLEPLIVDYVIHYVKSNGNTKEKVFKLREVKLKPGETKVIEKKHTLKNTSGRTHYSGIHYLELQINGKRYNELAFELNI